MSQQAPNSEAQHGRELEEEFAAVLSLEDQEAFVDQLIELAPRLSSSLLQQALGRLGRLSSDELRTKARIGIAPYLTPEQLSAELSMIRQMYPDNLRIEALGVFGQYVDETTRAGIIEEIKRGYSAETRLKGWLGLIEYLPPDIKEEAISTSLRLPEIERAEALSRLAAELSPKWKMQALSSIKSMTLAEPKVQALTALIPFLSKTDRANALTEAVSLSRSLSPFQRAEATVPLLPFLPEEVRSDLIRETITAGESSTDWLERLHVFVRVSSVVGAEQQRRLFVKCLDTVNGLTEETEMSQALILVARATPSWFRPEILQTARRVENPIVRSNLLIQLEGIFAGQVEEPFSSASDANAPGGGEADSAAGSPSFEMTFAPGSSSSASDGAVGSLAQNVAPAVHQPPENPPPPSVTESEIAPSVVEPKSKAARPKGTKKRAKSAPVEPVPLPSPEVFEPIGVKTYLHSDKWTLDDQLNYSLYANAIAEFIRHEDTHPPLAIGILAPWGQGKTTLMKLIQDQLEKKAKATPPTTPLPTPGVAAAAIAAGQNGSPVAPTQPPTNIGGDRATPPGRPRFKFADLKEWLRDPAYSPSVQTLHYPTVWFNAWKYQNSEQLWAAMAYCILNQLVSQIPTQLEREKFWLALQAERIDFAAVRRDIHRAIFESIAPWLFLWAGFGLIGIMLFVIGFALPSGANVLRIAGPATFSVSFLAAVGQWLWAKTRVHKKPLEGKFAQYVRQPTYEGKLGFFHEVEQDVRRVFKLLVSEKEPVVIFIDDLDRCSPGTVAQVIEAMNLFLSADFPDCYFIVGMDAQVVAASMEVAYENLDRKLKSVTRSYGSLGWYFMDKFIQLQFNIPNLNKEMRDGYLARLFGHAATSQQKPPTTEELNKIEAEVVAALANNEVKPEDLARTATQVAQLRVERPKVWQIQSRALIETGAKKLSDDNPELQKYLDDYKDLLGSSPRAIKRFANLFRFYSLTQYARQTQGLEASSPAALARWLVIMLRWPQLVRWIQWENETKLTSETDAKQKAAALEDQLCGTKTYELWLKHLEEMDPTQGEWLRDRHLYEFLKTPVATDRKLSLAVQNGVW